MEKELDLNEEKDSIKDYYEELKTQDDDYFAGDDTIRWMQK